MLKKTKDRTAAPTGPLAGVSESLSERYGGCLAAIRSAAEILRDAPDLGPGDRARFAEMVLAEEARLEGLLREMRRAGVGISVA